MKIEDTEREELMSQLYALIATWREQARHEFAEMGNTQYAVALDQYADELEKALAHVGPLTLDACRTLARYPPDRDGPSTEAYLLVRAALAKAEWPDDGKMVSSATGSTTGSPEADVDVKS